MYIWSGTKIKELRDGLTIDILKEKYQWVLDAEIENAIIGLKEDKIIWYDGIWRSGAWIYGIWKNGTWMSGVWHNGIWENGNWNYGLWKNGIWENGNWWNGTWENGFKAVSEGCRGTKRS